MVGMDLSPKMVEITKSTGFYNEVFIEDIHTTLVRLVEKAVRVDLVLSADTFIYVGQIDRCFQQCGRVLRSGGLFAFSVEVVGEEDVTTTTTTTTTTMGFRLLRSGRYAHSHSYIQRLCGEHGFGVKIKREIVVRMEQGDPIPGLVYVIEKE